MTCSFNDYTASIQLSLLHRSVGNAEQDDQTTHALSNQELFTQQDGEDNNT